MTNKTAKDVFDLILNELRFNGFTDVGSFLIDKDQKGNQNEEFNDNYEYVDNLTAISYYEALSKKDDNAILALSKLVDASLEYFNIAFQIPGKFSRKIKEFGVVNNDIEMSFLTMDNSEIEINKILEGESVADLIDLLKKIRNNIEQDDETFFKSIE